MTESSLFFLVDVRLFSLESPYGHREFLGFAYSGSYGPAGASEFLDTYDLHGLAREGYGSHEAGGVRPFASEADHEGGPDVGAASQSDESFGDSIEIGTELAASLVVEVPYGVLHLGCHGLGHAAGAHYARSLLQNAHRMVVETAVEGEFPVLDWRIWPVWQF